MRAYDGLGGTILVEVEHSLGAGGRGNVYPALRDSDIESDRPLVCKLLDEGYRSEGRRRKVECLMEIGRTSSTSAAWPLENVYDDGAWVGFLMPFFEGRSLDAVCADESVGALQRLDLASRACAIVGELHGQGVVFGDVCMANFIYDEAKDLLALIDLDSAQVVDGEQGTVYPVVESFERSPEMADRMLGDVVLTSRSDDFLAAVMAFRMLFGAHPLDSYETDCVLSEVRARNVKQRRFPYAELTDVMPVSAFGAELEGLFVCAFTGPYEQVPRATELASALDRAKDPRADAPKASHAAAMRTSSAAAVKDLRLVAAKHANALKATSAVAALAGVAALALHGDAFGAGSFAAASIQDAGSCLTEGAQNAIALLQEGVEGAIADAGDSLREGVEGAISDAAESLRMAVRDAAASLWDQAKVALASLGEGAKEAGAFLLARAQDAGVLLGALIEDAGVLLTGVLEAVGALFVDAVECLAGWVAERFG